MFDFVSIGITLLCFTGGLVYILACEKLKKGA
jgi:hypothetical protein